MGADVVIIGGGIIGSAIAYFLLRGRYGGRVVVVEPDASYARATTPSGAGGVRQLFSLPEHIRMSRYSLDFYKRFSETMAIDGAPAEIDFRPRGYLFVVGAAGARRLEANYRLQLAEGVRVELWDRDALARRFPSIGAADVVAAVYSPDDGWLDPEGALRGFRRQAERGGARYLQDRVAAFARQGRRMRSARLASGADLQGDIFVNAAGPWAGEVARMAGMPLPIQALYRLQHYWLCQSPIEPLPLVKDESGLFFRPEGGGYVGGRPSFDIAPGFIDDDAGGRVFGGYFERVVWPLLARRVPKFEALRCLRTWGGHYAENTLDGNMILGPWVGGCENFYLACGFGGHGIMHAPAAGLAMAELLREGRFSTIDLSRLGYQRVLDNAPYREQGII